MWYVKVKNKLCTTEAPRGKGPGEGGGGEGGGETRKPGPREGERGRTPDTTQITRGPPSRQTNRQRDQGRKDQEKEREATTPRIFKTPAA